MTHNSDQVLVALKKAKTSLDKILTMVEEDTYCIDVIQQNLAVIGLMKSANLLLLEGHMNNCIKNAVKEKDEKRVDEMMVELLKVVKIAQNK